MKLFDIYEAGAVMRYHTKRTAAPRQTVADHTWGACVIMMWLYYPDLPPNKMLQYMLLHDVPEVITGDMPAPAKWRSERLKAALIELEDKVGAELGLPLLPNDDPVVSYCDNAELAMHSIAQCKMGNRFYFRTAGLGIERMHQFVDKMTSDVMRLKARELTENLQGEVNDLR